MLKPKTKRAWCWKAKEKLRVLIKNHQPKSPKLRSHHVLRTTTRFPNRSRATHSTNLASPLLRGLRRRETRSRGVRTRGPAKGIFDLDLEGDLLGVVGGGVVGTTADGGEESMVERSESRSELLSWK